MQIPYREDNVIDEYKIKYSINFGEAHYIALEEVRGQALWGTNNNFAFGGYYAMIKQIISKYPYELVLPKTWQKFAHNREDLKLDEAKKRTAAAFRRFNPDFDETQHKADGLKDAFFVAYWCGAKNGIIMIKNYTFVDIGH